MSDSQRPTRKRLDPRATELGQVGNSDRRRINRGQPQPIATAKRAGQRVRRDPRAERSISAGSAGRQRVSLRGLVTTGAETITTSVETGPRMVRIDEPAFLVSVVPDAPSGRLTGHDRDLLGVARSLADAGGGAVLMILFGPLKDDPGAAGADRVMTFEGPGFAGYAPELRSAAVIDAAAQTASRHLLFPDSAEGGGELGRRVAAQLGERPATGAWRVDPERTTCRIAAGKQDQVRPTPRVLLVAAEAADPVSDALYEARPLPTPEVVGAVLLEDGGRIAVDPDDVALAEAEFIVSAGNGVQDWDSFHQLATRLGAAEAGSRVVVDAGFIPRFRQVGATGTLVTARGYLAFGISGAPQHLQGITQCDHVIAVNTELGCDMMKRASLSVVGDAQAIMPELIRLVEVEGEQA
ncbi:MAG: electron transfer flavoprotein subunit alpha/FixB family protein [Candidatus Thiodiazotropha sp.]